MKLSLQLAVLGYGLSLCAANAQTYAINWAFIGGDAGPSVGGGFSLYGSIGHPDARPPLNDGSFSVSSGFRWGVIAAEAQPTLSIRYRADNTIILTWPVTAGEFRLQEAQRLDVPMIQWTDAVEVPSVSGSVRQTTILPSAAARYYRLRKD